MLMKTEYHYSYFNSLFMSRASQEIWSFTVLAYRILELYQKWVMGILSASLTLEFLAFIELNWGEWGLFNIAQQ